ncbi:MAG TPA: acetyl-CoA C-acetyltransferase [Candidatus Wunengus sp. YC60]|uniref:acetyl-CoA C-acetyltransferase n=1 Tax=Candidatus Wunengus sp. YC60 TaxID=3367697 RepID=UPI004029D3A8
MPEEVVLISGVRTAVGKFGRAFKEMPAQQLGALVIKDAVKRAGLQMQHVEEVIMGNAISAGLGQNPARQAAIYAGIPFEIGSVTVNKVCGSGLKAVILAAQTIKAGDADIVVAGGMENMSAAPHLIRSLRWGQKFGDASIIDAMVYDGLWDVYNSYHMGITGERVAKKYGITRKEADEFSLSSHEKAFQATKSGRFKEEIIPVEVHGIIVEKDEGIREDDTFEKLVKLPPVFQKEGILTAGNSSQLSDGAAALVVASARKARELGIKPLARIIDYATGGTKPEDIMEAPIPTVKKLLGKTGFTINDMDLIEYNEAYATSSIVVSRQLDIDPLKLNVNGGAIALGHPIGCSGARILATLVHALKERGLKRGLATLCMGGGNALAMIIERCN